MEAELRIERVDELGETYYQAYVYFIDEDGQEKRITALALQAEPEIVAPVEA